MYKSLYDCLLDLEKHKQLVRIQTELDPDLEMAEVHRRFFNAQAPAILFERVKGSPFKAASNIYGTFQRTEFIFRHTMAAVKKVIALKADPSLFLKHPFQYISTPLTALTALPRKSLFTPPILFGKTNVSTLPQIKSWGMDGGAFITLPQVYTEFPNTPQVTKSNIGMYRIQLSGNDYIPNQEVGLHYQLHRGIGVHHTQYNQSDEPFRCSIFVGGPPSHAFAAIMPLPEGISETTFAGLLNGSSFRYIRKNGYVLSADADFVITGIIQKNKMKKEGPFGDHLGYYSLAHDFPVMQVENVYHRKDPIWQFTVVGRPPQEDSSFGFLIHELVKELAPQEFPGLIELNAVDAAGVHPLLLAIGSERYMPFRERKPEEILTIANRVLGTGQTSLAKYMFIAAANDAPHLDTHDIQHFFNHILERVDWSRDLHFQTKTTIDTLDYSGTGWNEGSKVVVACCGNPIRQLATTLPSNFQLPQGFSQPIFAQKGILILQCNTKTNNHEESSNLMEQLCNQLLHTDLQHIPLIVVTDDSAFAAANINNFVWVTFTRSNPSHDMYGVGSFVNNKHWGCKNVVIDARKKPHHAPLLEVDTSVKQRVDKLFSRGGELHEIAKKYGL